MKHTYSDLSD
uniref:Uncharacterized protein n=1 Tax=Anguilla anguilla TaxID=7936 RepID=A0A0E9S3M4_ANGAN